MVRFDDDVSVLYGRCAHRGALMADGHVRGANLICGVHDWDYRLDTGVSEYKNDEALQRFESWVDADQDAVLVDASEIEDVGRLTRLKVAPGERWIMVGGPARHRASERSARSRAGVSGFPGSVYGFAQPGGVGRVDGRGR